MKKLLTLLVLTGTALLGHSQTIFWQDFEGTKTAQPAGWSQNVIAANVVNGGWEFSNAYGTNMGKYVPTHTYCTFVDDWDNNTGDVANYDTLRTSSFNCSASSAVFVSVSYMFWNDEGSETGTVAVSTDGGKTWTTAINFPNNGGAWADSALYDISAYAAGQSNVMLGFCYYDGYNTPGTYVAVGMGIDNIDVYTPPNYDLSVASQNMPLFVQIGKPYTLSGTIDNYGGTQITSMNMNYTVNGGPVQTQTISGITGFTGLTYTSWMMAAKPFTPGTLTNYKIKVWADQLNGSNVDQNHKNDTLTFTVMGVDTAEAKTALFEEVVGQSCYYCMLASPNVDSVTTNNAGNVNVIHYHVPYPGPPDYMYSVSTSIGTYYETYYSVGGTPQGELDGTTLYPGALGAPQDFSTPYVANDDKAASPFKIEIVNPTFDPITNKYSATVNITAFAAFNAGLIARAAITNDLITYTLDYSSDDPTSSFQPPDGSTTAGNGGTPDYYFQFVENFPSVVEAMVPSTAGTTLTAFTANSTQTLNLSWTKNHPWSLTGKTYPYDSSATDRITVFVQTNSAVAALGIPAKYVYQSAAAPFVVSLTGLQQLSNEVSFEMYPNPTTKATNLNFTLAQSQEVNVQVYNMLGENVYSINNGRMSAGQHLITLNCSALQSGVYFVKFTTDNTTTTKRLVIQQ